MRFRGFSTGWSTHFCNIFWRWTKEYDKFTTTSNTLDTRGVCWLFGWGYLMIKVQKQKNAKKARKLEVWDLIWFDFLSLCSYIGYKAIKNVPASILSCSYYNLQRIRYGKLRWIFQVMAHHGLFSLQVCCILYVGMCLNNSYSLASIISGFSLFCCCVLLRIFLIAFWGLKC